MPPNRRAGQPPTPRPYLDLDAMQRLTDALGDPQRLDRLWQEVATEAEESSRAIDGLLAGLRDLLRQVDPLCALGALHMLDARRRATLPQELNFGSDAMLEVLASIVCSEDESTQLERIGEAFEPQWIGRIEQALRELGRHLMRIELGRVVADRTAEDATDPILSMLRFEGAFDRMSGFDPHLRRIATTIFAKVDDRVRTQLGFGLGDSLAFADVYSYARSVHARRAEEALAEFPKSRSDATPDAEAARQVAYMTVHAIYSAPPLEGGELEGGGLAGELARQLGVDDDQFAALVQAMGTRLGTIDPERVLSDASLRTRPLISTSSGQWTWHRPVDFIHSALQWAHLVCEPHPALLSAFDKARQRAAEQLTGDLLEEVFGPGAVHRKVTYPDVQSDAENDVVVSLPGMQLLVEAKGGRFSAAGRRAAPSRVDKHAKELVEWGANQNRRTAAAVLGGKPLNDRTGRRVPTRASDDLLPVVVTLDRVDPFSTYLGRPAGGDVSERNWVVNLADLAMIVDVLQTPEEFVAYVRRRVEMVRSGVRVFVEADCLGQWCANRLVDLQVITDSKGRDVRMVTETSHTLNDWFMQEAWTSVVSKPDGVGGVDKPTSGISPFVVSALESVRLRGDLEWLDLVDAVADVRPEEWKPLDRFLAVVVRRRGRPLARRYASAFRRARDGWVVGADNGGAEVGGAVSLGSGGVRGGGGVVVSLVSTHPLDLVVRTVR